MAYGQLKTLCLFSRNRIIFVLFLFSSLTKNVSSHKFGQGNKKYMAYCITLYKLNFLKGNHSSFHLENFKLSDGFFLPALFSSHDHCKNVIMRILLPRSLESRSCHFNSLAWNHNIKQ